MRTIGAIIPAPIRVVKRAGPDRKTDAAVSIRDFSSSGRFPWRKTWPQSCGRRATPLRSSRCAPVFDFLGTRRRRLSRRPSPLRARSNPTSRSVRSSRSCPLERGTDDWARAHRSPADRSRFAPAATSRCRIAARSMPERHRRMRPWGADADALAYLESYSYGDRDRLHAVRLRRRRARPPSTARRCASIDKAGATAAASRCRWGARSACSARCAGG